MTEQTWTAADGAGSARFSTNLRDPASYAKQAWAQRDRPWWMPEVAALKLLDELDLSNAVAGVVLSAAAVLAALILINVGGFIREEINWRRSSSAARQLVKQEKAAAAEKAAAKRAAASATEPSKECSLARHVRHCRFCDVPIEDEFVAAHEAGKKHKRLKAAAGSLAEGSCWVWRAGPAAPSGAQDEVCPAVDDMAPNAIATSAGKGMGAWSTAKPKKRR